MNSVIMKGASLRALGAGYVVLHEFGIPHTQGNMREIPAKVSNSVTPWVRELLDVK